MASGVPTIGIVRLPHGEGLDLPSYATEGAAGMDVRAALPEDQPVTLAPMQRMAIPTGLVLEIPEGFEVQVRPRSGLALKQGITCLNTPGTIDWDYRGEVKVLLVNLGTESVTIERGMRIAQLVVAPVIRATMEERRTATETKRGAGGFGSTGSA
ncbi:deoxyuridine 5'-triphosphate nucleotidohydrolase [Notoacmeibacter marinus]|uniref:Deoxyuridine 5'-triphosphate nucleotidohydrolase n=1 Tax=Notoacmeibacter marinus TaxID=1876515 RepID=A0A231V1E1_9HYPH|nr:dUTP diphosphatase [Notoacmeibacter marinus]OXT01861.1 deoxyuridine 5'-triphosphate nucleotidohydrolase [Notoacmeibacter marinus]